MRRRAQRPCQAGEWVSVSSFSSRLCTSRRSEPAHNATCARARVAVAFSNTSPAAVAWRQKTGEPKRGFVRFVEAAPKPIAEAQPNSSEEKHGQMLYSTYWQNRYREFVSGRHAPELQRLTRDAPPAQCGTGTTLPRRTCRMSWRRTTRQSSRPSRCRAPDCSS